MASVLMAAAVRSATVAAVTRSAATRAVVRVPGAMVRRATGAAKSRPRSSAAPEADGAATLHAVRRRPALERDHTKFDKELMMSCAKCSRSDCGACFELIAVAPKHHYTKTASTFSTAVEGDGIWGRVRTWVGIAALAGAGMSLAILAYKSLDEVPFTGRRRFLVQTAQEEFEAGNLEWRELVLSSVVVPQDDERTQLLFTVARKLVGAVKDLDVPMDWRFIVYESDERNASCLPGGRVAVSSGMLDFIGAQVAAGNFVNAEEALAVIVCHEVSHALAHHAAENAGFGPNMKKLATMLDISSPLLYVGRTYGLELPRQRRMEHEADEIGMHLLARCGYDLGAMPRFFKYLSVTDMGPSEFLSKHPADHRRVLETEALAEKLSVKYGAKYTKGTELVAGKATQAPFRAEDVGVVRGT